MSFDGLPRTIYVKVSTELLAQMFYDGWSQPVQLRPVKDPDDDTWELEIRIPQAEPGQ